MKYCMRCGSQIPPGYSACPRCGMRQKTGGGINNIFSALVHERTPGAIMEFTLWCVVCFIALLSLIAAIVGHGNVTWILLMIFALGLGTLMAFRLKPISLLYCMGVFNLLMPVVHYACFARSRNYFGLSYYLISDYGTSATYSPLNITLFIIIILLSLALVICGFVYNFTRVRMENLLAIGCIVDCVLIMLLQILMYAAPGIGVGLTEYGVNQYNIEMRYFLNYRGYWFGTICFWLMLIVIVLFNIFFYWGCMSSRPKRIIEMFRSGYSGQGNRVVTAGGGMLRGVSGLYAGRDIPLNGVMIIGSGNEAQIRINDPLVSRKHCAVRYNSQTGFYEVQDISQNGVFLSTGQQLQKDYYNSVPRGSVICIGSQAQQFRLM